MEATPESAGSGNRDLAVDTPFNMTIFNFCLIITRAQGTSSRESWELDYVSVICQLAH